MLWIFWVVEGVRRYEDILHEVLRNSIVCHNYISQAHHKQTSFLRFLTMPMSLLELLHIFLGNALEILHVEQQTKPQFQLNLRLAIFELFLPDLGDVQLMVENTVDKQFTMFF